MTSGPTSDTAYTVIVVTKETDPNEFLMVRHKDRGWELPGGKMEDNEGPVHCALREFREETGHLLAQPKFVLKMQKDNGTCYVFKGHLGARVQEVAANEAIQTMRWYTRLPPTDQLAFPDDPYDEIGQALGMTFE